MTVDDRITVFSGRVYRGGPAGGRIWNVLGYWRHYLNSLRVVLGRYDAVNTEYVGLSRWVHAKSRAHAGQTIRVTPKDAEKLARLRRVAAAVH